MSRQERGSPKSLLAGHAAGRRRMAIDNQDDSQPYEGADALVAEVVRLTSDAPDAPNRGTAFC